ncbi:hypothetical protein Agub_g5772 [Astrephomene gubernaculifera]|uniref:Response regulatory domain-containing protein n=1 Tax=Astrephomene gubernaculifera TaxID=47775 RepID=A0AAD3DPE9_9CHLO|nr:hypothetical protein Agub_g5772 [Astrephomene gubernaculifera]
MEDNAEPTALPKLASSGGRRIPKRTPSGLLGKPGSLQLNQSTTPQHHALPVKRRGSFQQLKKTGTHAGCDGASSYLDSDSSPSIFAVVKKSTHWEKYGTVLVLLVADELSSDKEAVLQMLSAEGYDDNTTDNAQEAVKLFAEKEVYPDIVIIDSDNELVDTRQLIMQLQSLNPTVAVMVLGARGGPLPAVQALQAGAADFMAKPLSLDELVARVERHVQRQHCIKLEMEKALEDAKQMMQQLVPASLLGDVMLRKEVAAPGGAGGGAGGPPGGGGAGGKAGLNSVAETDFEEQMSELSEENHRLGQKVQEMERKLELKDKENRALEAKLNAIDQRVAALAAERQRGAAAGGCDGLQQHQQQQLQQQEQQQLLFLGQLDVVARANLDLRHKVDELERRMQAAQGGGAPAAAVAVAVAVAGAAEAVAGREVGVVQAEAVAVDAPPPEAPREQPLGVSQPQPRQQLEGGELQLEEEEEQGQQREGEGGKGREGAEEEEGGEGLQQ